MRDRQLILCLIIGVLFITTGCAKRALLSYDQAPPLALVKIGTVSGQTFNGTIEEKNSASLFLRTRKNNRSLTRISRDEIVWISGREFVYDGAGKIIPESEIQEQKKNNNFLIYTIGGAGLSFGASFFIGSLIHRGMDDEENGRTVMWSTTAVGATVGTLLFAKSGKNRDRSLAIEAIRDQRFNQVKNQFESQKKKRSDIKSALEQEKSDHAKKQAELERLKEELEKKKKK
jgi:hypothetical protein